MKLGQISTHDGNNSTWQPKVVSDFDIWPLVELTSIPGCKVLSFNRKMSIFIHSISPFSNHETWCPFIPECLGGLRLMIPSQIGLTTWVITNDFSSMEWSLRDLPGCIVSIVIHPLVEIYLFSRSTAGYGGYWEDNNFQSRNMHSYSVFLYDMID